MRVLYVLPSLLTGGAESLVSQWSGLLAAAGHTVAVCTLYTGGPFAQRLAAHGVPLYNLNHDPGIEHYRLRRKYDPRLVSSLARLIRAGGYQIVHGHLFPSLLHLAFAAYLAPGPAYLYSEHSVHNRRRRHRAFKALDRFLYGRFHQVLPVSAGVRAALGEWLPELNAKMQVVPNTVNGASTPPDPEAVAALRAKLGIHEEERVVLYAGRLVPDKGPDVLLLAAAHLSQQAQRPVRFLLAGDGPLRAGLEAQARSLSSEGPVRVTYLGMRADLPALLGLADLVALPSRWEGLPMFLLEAMAAGKAVLGSNVGGIPDGIEHDVSGWLVPPEDPAALARGLDCLLARPELRQRLGSGARRAFVERFSPEIAIQALLGVYARFAPQMVVDHDLVLP